MAVLCLHFQSRCIFSFSFVTALAQICSSGDSKPRCLVLSSEEMLCCVSDVFGRFLLDDLYQVQEVPYAKLEGALVCFVCFYFLNHERILFSNK